MKRLLQTVRRCREGLCTTDGEIVLKWLIFKQRTDLWKIWGYQPSRNAGVAILKDLRSQNSDPSSSLSFVFSEVTHTQKMFSLLHSKGYREQTCGCSGTATKLRTDENQSRYNLLGKDTTNLTSIPLPLRALKTNWRLKFVSLGNEFNFFPNTVQSDWDLVWHSEKDSWKGGS